MKTIIPFDFATVVCDGCACRIDSNSEGGILRNYEDLIDWKLEDSEWQRVQGGNDEKWYCPLCAKDPSHRTHPGEGRVIVETTPLYGLKCDHCGREWEDTDIGGTSCEDFNATTENARGDDWQEIGGKWYCPDCYQTCKAMVDENDGVENWEEVYCSKCKYKDDCNEVEPRAIPCANLDECNSDCPYRSGTRFNMTCTAPADAKCPRIEEWKNEGIAKQEADNAAALSKCKEGGAK